MKIHLSEPHGPYHCDIDTDVMQVTLREVFLGVAIMTDRGEKLSVSMRDNGFEVHYTGDFGETGFDSGWVEFKDGLISPMARAKMEG